jgi:hypothetical protein
MARGGVKRHKKGEGDGLIETVVLHKNHLATDSNKGGTRNTREKKEGRGGK